MNKKVHYLGLDVHKETIAVSIAPQDSTEVRRYGIIGGTLDAVDKLLKKLGGEGIELRVVYEAGPCGFVLCRHLRSKGLICVVVAPSLIPKKASDRVKTDRRDADQLARLYRAGELTVLQPILNGTSRADNHFLPKHDTKFLVPRCFRWNIDTSLPELTPMLKQNRRRRGE